MADNMKQTRKSTTHEERYIHIRNLWSSFKYSDATIFARKENDGNWYMSVALCWKQDQFDRAIGRQNARRHYFAEKALRGRAVKSLGAQFNHNDAVDIALGRIRASDQLNNILA